MGELPMAQDLATSIDAEIQRIEQECRESIQKLEEESKQRIQRLEECKRVVADPLTLDLLRRVLSSPVQEIQEQAAPAAEAQPVAAEATPAEQAEEPATESIAALAQAPAESKGESASGGESTARRISAIADLLKAEEAIEERALAASAA